MRKKGEDGETGRSQSYQEYLANQEAQIKDTVSMQEPCWVGGIRRRLCFVPRHLRFRSSGVVIPDMRIFSFPAGSWGRPFPGKIEIPKRAVFLASDALAGQPERIRQKYDSLQAVPVGLNLREHGLVGLVGGEGKQEPMKWRGKS